MELLKILAHETCFLYCSFYSYLFSHCPNSLFQLSALLLLLNVMIFSKWESTCTYAVLNPQWSFPSWKCRLAWDGPLWVLCVWNYMLIFVLRRKKNLGEHIYFCKHHLGLQTGIKMTSTAIRKLYDHCTHNIRTSGWTSNAKCSFTKNQKQFCSEKYVWGCCRETPSENRRVTVRHTKGCDSQVSEGKRRQICTDSEGYKDDIVWLWLV